jgi:SM-20-related protein
LAAIKDYLTPVLAICHRFYLSNPLEKIFNTLVSSFIDDEVGIAEHFLSTELAQHLKDNLNLLYKRKAMQHAGLGNEVNVDHDKLYRSDMIYWLDREHNDQYENEFFDLMDSFVLYLNQTCYTGITGYEFHYALYEEGSFYKKHVDQFRNNESRQYSMIMYLNENWAAADGGELCIHHTGHQLRISPINGKSVFFKSREIEHEVLLTRKPRMSITGWLKVDA